MDILKECALSFQRLFGNDYIFTAAKNTHTINFRVYFESGQFPHLLGLNKLRDTPEILSQRKSSIFESILADKITYDTIKGSSFIDEISGRIQYFSQISTLLNSDIVLKFDNRKAYSTIHAKALIYQKFEDTYLHLFLNSKGDKHDILIPCSFFPRNDRKYIEHQEVYKILSIQKVPHATLKHEEPIRSETKTTEGAALSDRLATAQGKADEHNIHYKQPRKEHNRDR